MIADVLKGKVDIFKYSRIVSDLCNKLVGYLIGIAIKQSYPRDRGIVGYRAQKLGKLIRAVNIKTVSRGILRNKVKLAYTESLKLLCFLNKLIHRTGAELTSDKGTYYIPWHNGCIIKKAEESNLSFEKKSLKEMVHTYCALRFEEVGPGSYRVLVC